MNTLAEISQVLLLVVVLAGLLTALVTTLRHDGHGHRPVPRSHRGEGSPRSPHTA